MYSGLYLPKNRLENYIGIRKYERWIVSKMYYICENIDSKITGGSEILNLALDAKCTTFAKISIAKL